MTEFNLDPRLAEESVAIAQLSLCVVRLRNDARFPWCILIPMRPLITEVYELSEADQALLMLETARVAKVLDSIYSPHKVNIGALGNQVAQLHMHVVARRSGDAAWPGPVWGAGQRIAYGNEELMRNAQLISARLR
jgi:diadenosine tetraphosphate (Ap4A) HIT family hydrolase